MGAWALLKERYNFDASAWLLLSAILAVPTSLWVPPRCSPGEGILIISSVYRRPFQDPLPATKASV